MKRIVLTTVMLDPERGGGTAERTRQLALALSRRGCRCTIVAIGGTAWLPELRAAGVEVWLTGSWGRRFPVPAVDPVRLSRLLRGADLVHVLGYWNLLSALACLFARIVGTPYFLSAAGEFAALDRPRPVMRWFHHLFGRGMIRRARALVAITPLEAAETCARLKLPHDRVVVVPNGAAGPRPEPAADFRIRLHGRNFVLFMGRLAPIKGPDLLIDAFARIADRHPGFDLVVAGADFGLRGELANHVRRLGLCDRVHFTGHLDERMRTAAYRAAALLAVPSRSEAMSLVALEAAAEGTPVLITDRCGFDDVRAVGGGLVVPASADGLADGLGRLLADPSALREMGHRLQDHVRQAFGWAAVAGRLIEAADAPSSRLPCARRPG